MAEGFEPGRDPLLLVDEDVAAREALGVPAARTVLLVFDARGLLVSAHDEVPSRPAAARAWAEATRHA